MDIVQHVADVSSIGITGIGVTGETICDATGGDYQLIGGESCRCESHMMVSEDGNGRGCDSASYGRALYNFVGRNVLNIIRDI